MNCGIYLMKREKEHKRWINLSRKITYKQIKKEKKSPFLFGKNRAIFLINQQTKMKMFTQLNCIKEGLKTLFLDIKYKAGQKAGSVENSGIQKK